MAEPRLSPTLWRWLRRVGYALAVVWIVGSATVYFVRISFAVYETHGETVDRALAPLYPEADGPG